MPISSSRPGRAIFHSLICSGVQWRSVLWAPQIILLTAGYMLNGSALGDPDPQIFLVTNLAKVACNLESQRPPALSEQGKLGVIRSLPRKGEVTDLSTSQRKKLYSLEPLLGPAEHPTYQVKVIDVPQAFSGLYERAVLLISVPALTLWNSEELRAIVAHEIGHEYVWPQYQAALHERQPGRLQKLELYCDGIAILTLHRHGIDPSYLIAALEKAIRYNRDHYGRALNEDDYPTLHQRRQFHHGLIRRIRSMDLPLVCDQTPPVMLGKSGASRPVKRHELAWSCRICCWRRVSPAFSAHASAIQRYSSAIAFFG